MSPDINRDFDSLVWSVDGLIAAVTFGNKLGYAYDFQKHVSVWAPARKPSQDPDTKFNEWLTDQDVAIRSALSAHGGQGKVISAQVRREVGWWESRQFVK